MKKPLRKIRFRVKTLAKDPETGSTVWGWAWLGEDLIEIEKALSPYDKLNTLVHEIYHIFEPSRDERTVNHFGNEVERIARRLKLLKEDS